MRDEQAGQALASPRSNVKTLRELFNDKDARSTPRVASVKRPTEVRIPRPSLAPKPPNNRNCSLGSAKETSSPVGGLPESRGTSFTRAASFEHGRVLSGVEPSQQMPSGAAPPQHAPSGAALSEAASSQQVPVRAMPSQVPPRAVPSQQVPPRAVSSSDLCEHSLLPKAVGDRPASASCEAVCEEEEDYVTPITLSKPPEHPRRETVASSQPRRDESSLPKPVEGSSQRTKPKLPEPPLYVPAQFMHHPVASGWLRRTLPAATACPSKPARPSGMCLPVHSSLQHVAHSAAQPDRPLLTSRSTPPPPPPAPPSRAPPPRPLVPKPPRMLPSLPIAAPADDACSEPRQPTSPIPEYTEDEELGSQAADDEPYADTEINDKTLPPQDDVLYDDTLEDFYEEMPTEEIAPTLKTLAPKVDKEEHDNVCKTFGLPSGWEQLQPVDAGYARSSSTGGGTKNLDLPLQRGEPVYVLRFENNPPGKWLVRNHQGEVGYADLMNIEIMTMHRSPCTSMRKQQTSAMESEDEEAIYEETF